MNPAQGQPAQGQQNMLRLFRPEQMRTLNYLTDDEKRKYEEGLRGLYQKIEQFGPETREHQEAKAKIVEFSRMVWNKVRSIQARNQANSQDQSGQPNHPNPQQQNTQGGQAQNSLAASQRPASRPAGVGPSSNIATPGAAAPNATQVGQQAPQVVPKPLMEHVNKLPWQLLRIPAQITAEQGPKWLNEMKQRYLRNLMQMETSKTKIAKLDAALKDRQEKGAMTPEEQRKFQESKGREQALYMEAQRFLESVRAQMKASQSAGAPGSSAQQGRSQPMQNQPTHSMQAATASVNAAMDAAKNQQLAASRAAVPTGQPQVQQQQQPQHQQQPQAQSQAQSQAQAQAQPHQPQQQHQQQQHPGTPATPATPSVAPQLQHQQQHPQHPQHPQPHQQQQQQQSHQQQPQSHPAPTNQPQIKSEPTNNMPHPPPVNTALAAASAASHMPSAGTPTQTSARVQTPQSAGQATGSQVRPLTHAAAVNRANSSTNITGQANNSAGGITSTPGSSGLVGNASHPAHTHAHPQSATPAMNPKMPISKNLPPKATEIPQAVSIGGGNTPGRPSYGGGSATGGGTMSQPVIAKMPPAQFDAEGEHVLSKKKLDELVRQVCGGGSPGADGNYLTPDVEESVLSVADNFVDNVLHTACRLAKERGSKVLEIRDIQLVLERVYNIRIPGYTSDELRTVRKVQPSANWISKVHAVQAAKVMPGKDDK
ncbi:transcription initiation factor TFIID subunit A-domain-containing protein [Daldinia sp. FL1419]|nr:transcription initiation factor TFIID subunit A-domain-containing protein [Daldinia sp. FL1419]